MKLSVVVPSLDGRMPKGIPGDERLEVVVVRGLSPVSEARNEGLRRANGDWVAWVDADDEVCEAWLGTILAAVDGTEADGVDVVTFGAEVARSDGRSSIVRYANCEKTVGAEEYLRDILRDIGGSTWLWNKVFRRSLFDGLRFEGTTQEDFRIMPRALARARKVKSVPDVIYRYVRPEGSLTHGGGGGANAAGILAAIGDDLGDVRGRDSVIDAWRKGCALRAADWLRHSGGNAELRRFLRRSLRGVLTDGEIGWMAKAKCILAALGA